MTSDPQILDLQIRIAEQDNTIAALDDVLREFTRRVERLERELLELRARAGTEEMPAPTGHEKPPHY